MASYFQRCWRQKKKNINSLLGIAKISYHTFVLVFFPPEGEGTPGKKKTRYLSGHWLLSRIVSIRILSVGRRTLSLTVNE